MINQISSNEFNGELCFLFVLKQLETMWKIKIQPNELGSKFGIKNIARLELEELTGKFYHSIGFLTLD